MRSITAAVVVLALAAPAHAHAQMAPAQTAPTTQLSGIAGPANVGVDRRVDMRRIVERQRRTARTGSGGDYDPAVSDALHDIYDDIDRRRDNGELTRREARRLRHEASRIARLSNFYAIDGLSQTERSELRVHASVLASRANAAR